MKWLVFSRNRAYQLDALISSASANGGISEDDITIIHRYDDNHRISLERLIEEHPRCVYLQEEDFKGQVFEWVDKANQLVSFATDDAVFTRSIDHLAVSSVMNMNPNILTFSLRMGLHLDHCYPTNQPQQVPNGQVTSGIFAWDSSSATGDWGYPLSVDGHVFRSNEIHQMLKLIDFADPNTLEANLQVFKGRVSPITACFLKSCYMNIPFNMVQTTFNNRSGKVTAEMFEARFREGLRHDPSRVIEIFNKSAHQEMES